MDILNLSGNEGYHNQDFSLACISLCYIVVIALTHIAEQIFTGSGDIRNIIRTINELPPDYSGEIRILLNDQEPTVLLRNITLLCGLGIISDKTTAAECALHAWYSAFIPTQYEMTIGVSLRSFLENMKPVIENNKVESFIFTSNLGPTSNLCGPLAGDLMSSLHLKMLTQINITQAREDLNRVR